MSLGGEKGDGGMSVVACQITDSGYELAADSISVRWATQDKGKRTTFSKLTAINGLVIGGSGAISELGMMFTFAKTHRPKSAHEDDFLSFLAEFSKWKKDHIGDGGLNASYLVGYQGLVFNITGWAVQQVTSYDAIGAGMDFALAALYLGHSAKEAVEVATELSIYCEPPVKVIRRTGDDG